MRPSNWRPKLNVEGVSDELQAPTKKRVLPPRKLISDRSIVSRLCCAHTPSPDVTH